MEYSDLPESLESVRGDLVELFELDQVAYDKWQKERRFVCNETLKNFKIFSTIPQTRGYGAAPFGGGFVGGYTVISGQIEALEAGLASLDHIDRLRGQYLNRKILAAT